MAEGMAEGIAGTRVELTRQATACVMTHDIEACTSDCSSHKRSGSKQGELTSKEEEDTPLHAAEHGHEALADDKGEEHVHGHIEGAGGCSYLQRLNLTAHTTNTSVNERRNSASMYVRLNMIRSLQCIDPHDAAMQCFQGQKLRKNEMRMTVTLR